MGSFSEMYNDSSFQDNWLTSKMLSYFAFSAAFTAQRVLSCGGGTAGGTSSWKN